MHMLSFLLINDINIAIREMPHQSVSVELSKTAKRQLEALELVDGLLTGKSCSPVWSAQFHSFCWRKKLAGSCFSDENINDDMLLEELLASCEEDVLL